MNMIELTLIDGTPILVNLNNVSSIFTEGNVGTNIYCIGSSDDCIRVKESYDTIKRMISCIVPIMH